MTDSALSDGRSLAAYPTMSQAARLLAVSPSTLSRRSDVATERRGDRDYIVMPAEVLRLAYVYRRRSVNEVSAGLIDLGGASVEQEVEAFFKERGRR